MIGVCVCVCVCVVCGVSLMEPEPTQQRLIGFLWGGEEEWDWD